MARELKNANITHVSYVDKGANQKQFFLTKAAGSPTPTFQKEVKIIMKSEDEQQLVYGVVYEPDVADAHDDIMNADEIEKAAHKFMKDFRNIDTQHDFERGAGELVESYIAPVDMDIDGEIITKGSWVMVTKATDDIWESIKKGEFTGYSMAGTAETIEKKASKPVAKSDDDVKGFFNAMKSFFSGEKIQKGAVRDKYERGIKSRNFWSAMDSFETVIRSYNWQTDNYEFAEDETTVREAIQDFTEIMNEILLSNNVLKAIGKPTEEILKAGKKISGARMDQINAAYEALKALKEEVDGEEEVMKAEDIAKMLDEKLSPITKRLDAIEKEEGTGVTPTGEDDIVKQFGTLLDEKLTPINDRLDAVEKARGVSKQVHQEPTPVVKSSDGPSYMRHFE
ncbi:hypothetical protein B1NLA3E_01210 [Bacillus sp. 1NLA3E]|nr:XkdF-like putative serine protease domain-containing protein [Bacillus sp. 1NLA3E]AGK52026.1 hypothetical protein B1NLA3E_01210 [Bacillus sp. 1NLA3E]